MPPPSGIKLRDSCHACAAAKVKCSKDKPICARCEDRGTPCRYLVTQRTGRKLARRNTASSSQNEAAAALSTSSHSHSPEPPQTATGHGASLLDSPFMAWAGSIDDWLAPLHVPMSPPQSLSANTCITGNQQDIPGAHESYAGNSAFKLWQDTLSASMDTETVPDLSDYGPADPSSCSFPVTTQPSQLGETQRIGDSQQPNCLMIALRLMGQLSSQCPTTADREHHAAGLRLQMVVDENRGILESIGAMMQFPGSHDGYFLVVASLVVSRVLNRYAAAVHGSCAPDEGYDGGLTASTATSSTSTAPWATSSASERVPGAALEAGERDPQTAQRVLSELYQVQRLVDQLGSRTQICVRRSRMAGSEASQADGDATRAVFPFSVTVLKQLDTELRKSLSTLSLELIDGLRQYWG